MGLPQNSGDDHKLTLVVNFCNNLGRGHDFGKRSRLWETIPILRGGLVFGRQSWL